MIWGTKQGNAYDVVYGYGAYGNTGRPDMRKLSPALREEYKRLAGVQ